MDKLIEAVFSAPTATVLVIAGVAFLGIAVVGNVSGKISPGTPGRIASGVIGAVLLVSGIVMQSGGRSTTADTGTSSSARLATSVTGTQPTQAAAQTGIPTQPVAQTPTKPVLATVPPGRVVVTDNEGRTTVLDLDTFDFGGAKEIQLQSGVSIRFDRIRRIEMPNPGREPVRLVITLVDGQVLTEDLSTGLGPISSTFNGDSDVGKFHMNIRQVGRVQFPR